MGGSRRRRALVAPLLVLAVAAPACGDDADVAEPDVVEPDIVDAPTPEEPSLVGLEVTAAGTVTEVIAPLAFRIDKDGLGTEATGRSDDEDFADITLSDQGVLVLDVAETGVELGSGVRVTGTVREFDLPEAERVFDVELDDRVYGRFYDELVIVADTVATVGQGAAEAVTPEPDATETDAPPALSLAGLEVTAAGNVTELLDPMAFRIDKDGVGDETHNPVLDDEAFDDVELAERHVLVIDPGKTGLNLGEPVRISGTVRELDIAEAERLFDVDLDDRLFGPYERELVIFADEVTKLGGRSTTTRR
jgi:hypothetical protein